MIKSHLVLYIMVLFVCAACKKDDTSDCERLEGRWQLESWMEDGEEFYGPSLFIVSSDIDFGILSDHSGDIEWNITYIIGGTETVSGEYVVNSVCNEVMITPSGGVESEYHFSIDGDILILEGNNNNIEMVIIFRRE